MKQHTPWRKLRKNAFTYTIVDKEGNYIFELPASKDVHNTIVKACNNHDRLVEALSSLSETVAWLADNNGDDATKLDAAFKEVADVKQLLTELKS